MFFKHIRRLKFEVLLHFKNAIYGIYKNNVVHNIRLLKFLNYFIKMGVQFTQNYLIFTVNTIIYLKVPLNESLFKDVYKVIQRKIKDQ